MRPNKNNIKGEKKMNKKIIVLMLTGMFLLTGLTSISVVGQRTQTLNQTKAMVDDLPDLIIRIDNEVDYFFDKNDEYYGFYLFGVEIKNIGDAPVLKGEKLEFVLQFIKDDDIVYEQRMDWSEDLPLTTGPNDDIGWMVFAGQKNNPLPYGATIRAVVDQCKLITEIDDSNNVDVCKWPYRFDNTPRSRTLDEPKYEYSWKLYEISTLDLKNANFEYSPIYLGKIWEYIDGGMNYRGCFFNVKITGEIKDDSSILLMPLIRFRINLHQTQEKLGIEPGDYIELTASFFTTLYGAGRPWIEIDPDGNADATGFATNINLKVFDQPPQ